MTDINEINELVGSKQFQEAKVLIDEMLKDTPNDLELLKLAGLTYINLNLWQDAKKHFETVVKFESEDATSWFYLAKCYEKLEDLISAKNAYISVFPHFCFICSPPSQWGVFSPWLQHFGIFCSCNL